MACFLWTQDSVRLTLEPTLNYITTQRRRGMSAIRDAVLDAVMSGFSVLPWAYVGGSKKPMMKWKALQQEPLKVHQAADWWKLNPDHNWGAITGSVSGIVVIDLDNEEALNWAFDNLPPTEWRVTTGRGEHWGYRHPGGKVANRTGIGGMKIDLRGDGGWVSMPPSVHKSGAVYEWASFSETMPMPDELPVFDPAWLPEDVKEIDAKPAAPAGSVDERSAFRRATLWLKHREPAVEGNNGDIHTYRTCARMVKEFALSENDAYEALIEWNETCDPPWSEAALRQKIRNAKLYGTSAEGSQPDLEHNDSLPVKVFEDTDIGNGERFAYYYGDKTKYCKEFKSWFVWNGKRWEEDTKGVSSQMAKKVARMIAKEGDLMETKDGFDAKMKWTMKSRSATAVRNILTMAQTEEGIPASARDFDGDIWILNTPTGMVDLRTGEIKPHDPKKLCTKMTSCGIDPSMETPHFDRFMNQIFDGNKDLIRFVMQALGYSLTGSSREHLFFFAYGTGANGKGTLLNMMMSLMGDYAAATPEGLLMARNSEKHLAELLMLRGLRMAVGAETQEGRRLNEARMKNLTGGDPITADSKGGAYVTFEPTHTLWLLGNHKPTISGTDNGVWRRTRLLPFDFQVPADQRDPDLPEKLRAEAEGILAKLTMAAVDWFENGFISCSAVDMATEAYKNEEDSFGTFIEEKCVINAQAISKKTKLRQVYQEWARLSGVREMDNKTMGERMRRLGFTERRIDNCRYWNGVGIHTERGDAN